MVDLKQIDQSLEDLKVREEPVLDKQFRQIPNYKLIRRISDNQEIAIVSDNYQTYQHRNAYYNTIDKLNKLGLNFELKSFKTNIDNRHNRIHVTWSFPEISFDIDGSKTTATLELLNSTDGTMGYHEFLGLYRVRCQNGLIIGDDIFKSYRRHYGDNFNRDIDNIDQFRAALDSYDQIKEAVECSRTVKASKEFVQKLIDAGFPAKVVVDNFINNFYQYVYNYDELIKDYRSVYAYYALLTNWLSHKVAKTNFRREVRLSKKLSQLMLNETGGVK